MSSRVSIARNLITVFERYLRLIQQLQEINKRISELQESVSANYNNSLQKSVSEYKNLLSDVSSISIKHQDIRNALQGSNKALKEVAKYFPNSSSSSSKSGAASTKNDAIFLPDLMNTAFEKSNETALREKEQMNFTLQELIMREDVYLAAERYSGASSETQKMVANKLVQDYMCIRNFLLANNPDLARSDNKQSKLVTILMNENRPFTILHNMMKEEETLPNSIKNNDTLAEIIDVLKNSNVDNVDLNKMIYYRSFLTAENTKLLAKLDQQKKQEENLKTMMYNIEEENNAFNDTLELELERKGTTVNENKRLIGELLGDSIENSKYVSRATPHIHGIRATFQEKVKENRDWEDNEKLLRKKDKLDEDIATLEKKIKNLKGNASAPPKKKLKY